MKLPLSLYVHFPWCVRKCPYCDFNSHEPKGKLPEVEYINALIADLDRDLKVFNIEPGQKLHSIFMGGGTPSLFAGQSIQRFMDKLSERLTLDSDTEVTLEANPGTADVDNFSAYRDAGINRLSLGVQSFGRSQLQALGRIHTSNEAVQAFHAARIAGFENINLDLMHGLPQQNLNGALNDLETAIGLEPEHISWYQLTVEPNTVFYNRPPKLPNDDDLWAIYEKGESLLSSHGYHRYEVSAFCRPERASKHNLNYWQFGDYLGIGAGAHGKLSIEEQGKRKISRTNKTRLPADYLRESKLNTQIVNGEEYKIEFLMNGLRLVEGFETKLFENRTGQAASQLEPFYLEAESKGLLARSENNVRPTSLGLQYLNDLLVLATDY